MDEQFCVTMK